MELGSETRLGPYRIVSAIGAGGMGEVYRARDPRLEREVAIKILPASFSSDPSRLHRFEQEARAAAALNHPNILAVHDIGTQNGSPYIVSELLDGATLRERLRSGPLPIRKAIDYAQQIARGLAAAHDKGIVHRDLKPENIFVTNDGRVKILDFGLAKLTQPESVTHDATHTIQSDVGAVVGTVGYMSPEQLRGRPADARSDIFSFGAVLCEMLTGQRTFKGESPADTVTAILNHDPPDLTTVRNEIPPALDTIVRHCLEKNPQERFQSARDVAFDLERLSGISERAAATVSVDKRQRKLWLNRVSLLPVVVTILVALALGAFLESRLRTPSAPSFQRLTFRRGTIQRAKFAPDGKTIVYTAEWSGGAPQLYATNVATGEPRTLDLPSACLLSVSTSGELAVIVDPVVLPHNVCRGTLARAPIGGGAPRPIVENALDADWSPDGKTLAIIRLAGGKQILEFPPGKLLYQTGGWINHPRVSPEGDRIAFMYHSAWPDDRGALVLVDTRGATKVLSEGWVSENGLAWSKDGKDIWFAATKMGNSRSLHAVDMEGRVRDVIRVPGGLRLHDIAVNGDVLVTRDETRNGIMGRGPGHSEEIDLSWLDWSLSHDLSADGKTLVFDEEGDGGGENYSVFLRNTDGSLPVRLGPGTAAALSRDGKWVASVLPSSPAELILLPTGAGETVHVPRNSFEDYIATEFFPDNKSLLISATEPGKGPRVYVQPLDGNKPHPVTPEGVASLPGSHALSPDGKWVLAVDDDRRIWLYSVLNAQGHPLAGADLGDIPIRWSSDGGSVFLYRKREYPLTVFRVSLQTGKKGVFKQLSVPDRTGLNFLSWFQITPDGKYYAYTFSRTISDLYLLRYSR